MLRELDELVDYGKLRLLTRAVPRTLLRRSVGGFSLATLVDTKDVLSLLLKLPENRKPQLLGIWNAPSPCKLDPQPHVLVHQTTVLIVDEECDLSEGLEIVFAINRELPAGVRDLAVAGV